MRLQVWNLLIPLKLKHFIWPLVDGEDLYHLNGREKRFYGCQ